MSMTLSKWNVTVIAACLLWCGCSDEQVGQGDGAEEPVEGLIHYRTAEDYHTFILDDGEPEEVFFDASQRSFDPRNPIQVSVTEDLDFLLRAYSPRKVVGMKVWAAIDGYPEKFLLARFDILPPFAEVRRKLPFAHADKEYVTESGKTIRILANPHISAANLSLEIDCDDPYYKKFSEIKTTWTVRFSKFEGEGSWKYPMKTGHCREAVAMSLNAAYMFSSPEYEAEMRKYNGCFYANGSGHGPGGNCGPVIADNKVLIEQALWHYNGIAWGHVNGVGGLGGGQVLGLTDDSFVSHYADDTGGCMAWFHEFGHGMGYGDGNNTVISNDGDGAVSWRKVCQELYKQMCIDKKLPVYSRRFMHSRRNYDFWSSERPNWRYSPSSVIIEDPELDEIDGGLSGGDRFLPTDFGANDGNPLSFKLNHETAGADKRDYAPSDVYVYGDTLYVANDMRPKDASLDVYDLSDGSPVLVKRITGWRNPDSGKEEPFNTQVRAVVRSNGKLYVAAGQIHVYDALTHEHVCRMQYSGRRSLAATNGKVYAIGDMVNAFPEHLVPPAGMSDVPSCASTPKLGGNGDNCLAADYAGSVYALVGGEEGMMMRMDTKYLMAGRLSAADELKIGANPTGAAWSGDGRLFVAFGGTEPKFCEMDPESGQALKDYTTVAGITLNRPTRCVIRRNTLFVVDRQPEWCVYAIPMSEFK